MREKFKTIYINIEVSLCNAWLHPVCLFSQLESERETYIVRPRIGVDEIDLGFREERSEGTSLWPRADWPLQNSDIPSTMAIAASGGAVCQWLWRERVCGCGCGCGCGCRCGRKCMEELGKWIRVGR